MGKQDIRMIPDYPAYGVDREGNVYSFKFRKKKEMSLQIVKGYYQVGLIYKKKWQKKKVHRLVAEAFIPNPENKPQINHINGVKTDNRVENLEWNTAKENMQHAFKTGLNSGEQTKYLTQQQVKEIRDFIEVNKNLPRKERMNQMQIAEYFEVTISQVAGISQNKTYK